MSVPDPTPAQVVASDDLETYFAYVVDGDRLDESRLSSALCGCLQLRTFGLTFHTRGRHPAPPKERHTHDAAKEAAEHLVFHAFGLVLGSILLAPFRAGSDPYKQRKRIGKQMLKHPASFALAWTALESAEYDGAVELSTGVFDPLRLNSGAHTVFVKREPSADAAAVPVDTLFARRASFERFESAIAVIAEARAAKGLRPLKSYELATVERRWFKGPGSEAAERAFARVVGVDLSFEEIAGRAEGTTPVGGWNFVTRAFPQGVAPWPELL